MSPGSLRIVGRCFIMTYEEQLQTPEWRYKRQEIIDRDWGLCNRCLTSKNLVVHHKYYIDGRMAWEYPNGALITLCQPCHELEHSCNKIPIVQSSLDEALERLVNVAQGVRGFFKRQIPDG